MDSGARSAVVTLLVLGTSLILPAACGDDEEPARTESPEAGAGGDGDTGGSSGSGATGGKGSGGRSSTGGRTASGGNGATGGNATTGGTAGTGGATASGGLASTGGGLGTGGAGNTGGSSSGGVSGTGGSGTGGSTSGCSGNPAAVCVDVLGSSAAFLDQNGEVLAEGPTPIEHVLPAGGIVLANTTIGAALHFDVPAGTVLRSDTGQVPAVPTAVRSIEVDIPAPPNGQTVLSATGCPQTGGAARELVGTGVKTFEMTTACLEGGRAAFHAFAGNAYIYVSNIDLGTGTTPLKVALPAWTTLSSQPQTRLSAIPANYLARVTYRPRHGSGELANATVGLDITNGTGVANVQLYPNVGKEWRRFIQLDLANTASYTNGSAAHASVGHPLGAVDAASTTTALLPIAGNIAVSSRTVSFSFPYAVTGADRLVVNVVGQGTNGTTLLRVVAAPSRTSFKVPATLPASFADYAVNTIESVGVILEDLPGLSGYAATLSPEQFLLQFPGDITDPLGRQSFHVVKL